MTHHTFGRSWLAVLPTALLLILALVLTGTTSAAPTGLEGTPAQTTETPVCATCHVQEQADWLTSTHAKTGATCQSCHGEYKEGHPAGETMTLPMESEICRSCHGGLFAQWEVSAHSIVDVDCYDCHLAHTQGLRIEPKEKLCSACHTKEETQLTHSVHNISGIACATCHMSPLLVVGTEDGVEEMSNHTFAVASDVCARCHVADIHGDTPAPRAIAGTKTEADTATIQRQDQRLTELEYEVSEYAQRVERTQNIAVAGIGLALGLGGMGGLVLGIAVMTLMGRRKQS